MFLAAKEVHNIISFSPLIEIYHALVKIAVISKLSDLPTKIITNKIIEEAMRFNLNNK